MFEYILAGFTGSFFSYVCVFYFGAELHSCATSTASDRIINKIDNDNEIYKKNNVRMEKKIDKMLEHLARIRYPELIYLKGRGFGGVRNAMRFLT
jgi:hypothetical protein